MSQVFIGSSNDLKIERRQLEGLLREYDFDDIVLWEDTDHAMTKNRFQDSMNKKIKDSDIVIIMVKSRYGKYTKEEFEYSYDLLKKGKLSKLYLFFFDVSTNQCNPAELKKIGELRNALREDMKIDVKGFAELENYIRKHFQKNIGISLDTLNLSPINFSEKEKNYSNIIGRTWIIDKINTLISLDPNKSVFLLTADAGYGKSAIAAYLKQKHPKVIGTYYVQFGDHRTKNPTRFMHTIIGSLYSTYDWYREIVPNTIGNDDEYDLFDKFIYQPFVESKESIETIYIVDGIDEAVEESQVDHKDNPLADFISRKFIDTDLGNFKLIMTGRREERLFSYFNRINDTVLEMDAETELNKIDCRLYIRYRIEEYLSDIDNIEEVEKALISKSELSMLYLKKFFDMVDDNKKNGIDDTWDIENFPNGLGEIYFEYFKRIASLQNIRKYTDEYAPILEIMVAYNEPVPKLLLNKMLNIDNRTLDDRLDNFGTLIEERNNRLYFYHKSLKEWLLVTENDRRNNYRIEVDKGEERLMSFLESIDDASYKEEYIDLFHLNRKLFDYHYENRSRLGLNSFFNITSKIDISKKKDLYSDLGNHYVMNNFIVKAKYFYLGLISLLETIANPENENMYLYVDVLLGMARVLDRLLDEDSDLYRDRAQRLLESNKNDTIEWQQAYSQVLRLLAISYGNKKQDTESYKYNLMAYNNIKELYDSNKMDNRIYAFDYAGSIEGVLIKTPNIIIEQDSMAYLDMLNELETVIKFMKENMGSNAYYQKRYFSTRLTHANSIINYKDITGDKTNQDQTELMDKLYSEVEDVHNRRKDNVFLDTLCKIKVSIAFRLAQNQRYSEAIQINKEALNLFYPSTYEKSKILWSYNYERILGHIAWNYDKLELYDRALPYKEKRFNILRSLIDKNPNRFAVSYIKAFVALSYSYRIKGKYDEDKKLVNDYQNKILEVLNTTDPVWTDTLFKEYKAIKNPEARKGFANQVIEVLFKQNPNKWTYKYIETKIKLTSYGDDERIKLELLRIKHNIKILDITSATYIINPLLLRITEKHSNYFDEIISICEYLIEYPTDKYYNKKEERMHIALINNFNRFLLNTKNIKLIGNKLTDNLVKVFNEIKMVEGNQDWKVFKKLAVFNIIEFIFISTKITNWKTLIDEIHKLDIYQTEKFLFDKVIDILCKIGKLDKKPFEIYYNNFTQKNWMGKIGQHIISNIINSGIFFRSRNKEKSKFLPITLISNNKTSNLLSLYSIGDRIDVVKVDQNEKGFVFATVEFMENYVGIWEVAEKENFILSQVITIAEENQIIGRRSKYILSKKQAKILKKILKEKKCQN